MDETTPSSSTLVHRFGVGCVYLCIVNPRVGGYKLAGLFPTAGMSRVGLQMALVLGVSEVLCVRPTG